MHTKSFNNIGFLSLWVTNLTVSDDVRTCHSVIPVVAGMIEYIPLTFPRTGHARHAPEDTAIQTKLVKGRLMFPHTKKIL